MIHHDCRAPPFTTTTTLDVYVLIASTKTVQFDVGSNIHNNYLIINLIIDGIIEFIMYIIISLSQLQF